MRITYITTISIISLPGYYKYVKINVILQVKYKREIYIFISTDNINTSYTIIDTIFAMASRPVSYTHLDVYKRQMWKGSGVKK